MRTPRPTSKQLQSSLPLEVWSEAERQAKRSPLMRFRTGAALWRPDVGIVSTGTAHHSGQELSQVASIHAEHHALRRAADPSGAEIAIVTLGSPGNWTHSSCPCYSCAHMLLTRNISLVHYALWQDGRWQIISEEPGSLMARAEKPCGRSARKQRIPAPMLPVCG